MKNKTIKTVLKFLLTALIILSIAAITYLIFYLCGFTKPEYFINLRDQLGNSFLTYLIIGALQIIQVIFIPVSNQLITVPAALIFNDNLLYIWITSWISIWIATLILYFIGRWGGEKILKWLLNDTEAVNKCTNIINRGKLFYPLAMLLPLPDDIVTVLAGTSRMSFIFVLISSLFTRAIDTACSVFGFGYLTKFWWGWIILIVGIILLGLLTFLFYKYENHKSRTR